VAIVEVLEVDNRFAKGVSEFHDSEY
jgi:hypothetical protein